MTSLIIKTPLEKRHNALETGSCDVIIVGAGLAGLAAALTAAEFGFSPVVLEKAGVPGGATLRSDGGFNAADARRQIALGIEDTPERHLRHALERSNGKGREALLRTLTYEAYGVVQWLEALGLEFEERIVRIKGGYFPRTHMPKIGKGAAYVRVLRDALNAFNVPIICRAGVNELMKTGDAVVGVKGECLGKPFTLTARHGVILAGGSFMRNREMVRLYAPGLANVAPWMTEGGDGSALLAAADAGAGLVGMSYFELGFTTSGICMPDDPAKFILVNNRGERFVREDLKLTALLEAVMRQPEGKAWIIAHAMNGPEPLSNLLLEAKLSKAAAKFNEGVMLGRDDPFGRDKRLTRTLNRPYCFSELTPRILSAYGGLEINERAEVLDRRGHPIKGLCAAGDITGGIHGEHALKGDMLASAAVFGRIAARTLLKGVQGRRRG